jgi:uncharacterized protein YndB with AHSA1/START domain
VIDVVEQINAVRRRVGSRVLEVGEGRTVIISRIYDAPVEDVWDACTNPERIPRWFLPVSGELRVGGRYQLESNASGTIVRCEPPRGFAATWEYAGETTWVEVRVTPEAGGQTRFELEHISPVEDEKWSQFGPGATGVGWEVGLLGLAIHLATGDNVEPGEVQTWSASEPGRQFMALSSQGWFDASIAAGTNPADARAAAERTTAFYTAAETEASPGSNGNPGLHE